VGGVNVTAATHTAFNFDGGAVVLKAIDKYWFFPLCSLHNFSRAFVRKPPPALARGDGVSDQNGISESGFSESVLSDSPAFGSTARDGETAFDALPGARTRTHGVSFPAIMVVVANNSISCPIQLSELGSPVIPAMVSKLVAFTTSALPVLRKYKTGFFEEPPSRAS